MNFFLLCVFAVVTTVPTTCIAGMAPNAVQTSEPILPCAALAGNKLDVNKTCKASVDAGKHNNPSYLNVQQGERYIISVPAQQVWKDASRPSVPPCGDKGSWIMNLLSWLKRAPDSDWFSLIAEAEGEGQKVDICNNSYFEATGKSTELTLYANDAWGFYWNNSGVVTINVFRER